MKTPLTMPDPSVLYSLAKRAKDKAAAVEREIGDRNAAMHLNHIGNLYLIANGGR